MRGVWLEAGRIHLREDLPIPEPLSNEALIRVLAAGICNTDIELQKGYYPFTGILGHEFVGVVVQGPSDWMHQRIVGEINLSCGDCAQCCHGRTRHCEHRNTLGIHNKNGAFAEYVTLPVSQLHRVPDSVSTEAATFTEPLAAALEIQTQMAIATSDRVLVIGAGKLGHLVAQTLRLTGCQLLVVDRHADKLALLAEESIQVVTADAFRPQKNAFDVVVECTGNPSGFALALQVVRPQGTVVLKSTYAEPLQLDASRIVVNELTVMGSRCGPFDQALRCLAKKSVSVEKLIQSRYSLLEAEAAFDHARLRGVMKVLLLNAQ